MFRLTGGFVLYNACPLVYERFIKGDFWFILITAEMHHNLSKYVMFTLINNMLQCFDVLCDSMKHVRDSL